MRKDKTKMYKYKRNNRSRVSPIPFLKKRP